MRVSLYSVYDVKADQYGNPFQSPSNATAIRSFFSEVVRNDPNNVLHSYPGDFFLYAVGFFDTDSGVVESLTPPTRLVCGSDAQVM